MRSAFSVTERDRAILLAVLHQVPVLSEAALSCWWQDTDASRDNMGGGSNYERDQSADKRNR